MKRWIISGTCLEISAAQGGACALEWPPPAAPCRAVLAWHIEAGHVGAVRLEGLHVALTVASMPEGTPAGWRAAAYLDRRASKRQRQALMWALGGQDGGLPARLAPRISHLLGVKSIAINCVASSGHYALAIPGVLDVSVEYRPNNASVPPPGAMVIAPEGPVMVGSLTYLRYTDYGMNWQSSGGCAFRALFHYGRR